MHEGYHNNPEGTPMADNVKSISSAAEKEATDELIQCELAGKTMYVPPVSKWRASALHAIREGDLQTWAEKTLLDDDWDLWQEIDPTLDEVTKFFETLNGQTGVDSGNSRSSRGSSRNTSRR
jgi:hypothetical protein